MSNDGQLRLDLTNVYGERLDEKVDIYLRHTLLNDFIPLRGQNAVKVISITDLRQAPQGTYKLDIDPPSYLAVSRFVEISSFEPTRIHISFPIDTKKIVKVVFPAYKDLSADLKSVLDNSTNVLGYEGMSGKALYDALDNVRKAGLLNIAKKSEATILTNGRSALSYMKELKELRGDRFFIAAPKELREETKHSANEGIFHEASDLLHHPPDGYDKAGSYKTEDRYGNLQLSFFLKGNDCVVDADIDDAGGIEHVFQVLRNAITGKPTNPYNIHEILVGYQKLNPGYRFVV